MVGIAAAHCSSLAYEEPSRSSSVVPCAASTRVQPGAPRVRVLALPDAPARFSWLRGHSASRALGCEFRSLRETLIIQAACKCQLRVHFTYFNIKLRSSWEPPLYLHIVLHPAHPPLIARAADGRADIPQWRQGASWLPHCRTQFCVHRLQPAEGR